MTNSPLPVLINREGGAAAKAGDGLRETIEAAFAAAGTAVDIQLLAAGEMAGAVKRAASANRRIVVAGGDGTIACAVQVLIGKDTELALLPLGTLNHFARDLGIPAELEAAAVLAGHGTAIEVDVGSVNGHRFVNNASIGLYPSMVRERDAVRERHNLPKWIASVPALWNTLSRLPRHRLRVDMGAGDEPLVTPLLFVGNNVYSLERGTVGSRSTLQDGKLGVYAVTHRGRMALMWFAARALVGRADRRHDFVLLGDCTAINVRAHGRTIEIALDGELQRLSVPLKFEIQPAALRVVAPLP